MLWVTARRTLGSMEWTPMGSRCRWSATLEVPPQSRGRPSPGGRGSHLEEVTAASTCIKAKPWTISSQLAIAMLSELDGQHPFTSDPGTTVRPEVLFSCSMTPEMRSKYWLEIRLPEDRWSRDVEFAVTQDPFRRNHWRKIGIVDHSTGRATFRSTTRDATYG